MLRSVKSTQRKIRQIELIIKKTSADGASATFSINGPASNQVVSVTDPSNNGQITIALKQGFAAAPVIIANTSTLDGTVRNDDLPMVRKGSSDSGDELILQHSIGGGSDELKANQVIHVLIIGSDVDSKL